VSIRFASPVCQTTYVVQNRDAGKKSDCKTCGQRLQVPVPPPSKTVLGEVVLPTVPAPPPSPRPRRIPVTRTPDQVELNLPPPPLPLPPGRRTLPTGAVVAAVFIGLGVLGGAALVVVLAATQEKDRGTTAARRDENPSRPAGAATDPRPEPSTAGAPRRSVAPDPDPPVGIGPLSGEQVFRLLVRSSVLVASPHGAGTGFVADEANRLVVTNSHVVEREPQVAVVFPICDRAGELVTDSRTYERAIREVAVRGVVLARKPVRDLALIRVERLGNRSAAVRLAAHPAPTGASV